VVVIREPQKQGNVEMGKQQRPALWLIVSGIALLAALSPLQAAAQYGGQPVHKLFDAPQDAARLHAARPKAEDPFNPDVWLAKQVRGDRSAPAARRGAVRPASHAEPLPPGGKVISSKVVSRQVVEGEEIPAPMPSGPAPMPSGEVAYEIGPTLGVPCESCGHAAPEAGPCPNCGNATRYVPCRATTIEHAQVFAGPQGFKGPRGFGLDGSFGFHEGFNLSGPFGLMPCHDIGYQVGFQALQSDLSGTSFSSDIRTQYFVTAGFFTNNKVGLNYGAVYDYFHDEYYRFGNADQIDLSQVRGQVSFRNVLGHEFGTWIAVGTDRTNQNRRDWTPVDQYTLFYRWRFEQGANIRFWGGLSGHGDGIIGSDFWLPVSDTFALAANWNYLIPEQGNGPAGAAAESWNIGLNLVWHLHGTARQAAGAPYLPMFNVANNGYFFVRPQ
jgi:hypothetical protein